MRVGSAVVALVLLIQGLVMAPSIAAPDPSMTWAQRELVLKAYEGTSTLQSLDFTFTGSLTAPGVNINGNLREVASVDMGSPVVRPGGHATIRMTINLPSQAKDSYVGDLQLTANGRPVAKPLRVEVRTTRGDAQTIPDSPSSPSPDRIGDWLGQSVVVDQLIVGTAGGVADPDSVIRDIAQQHGGQIVGSVPGYGMYELRIPGASVASLNPIRDAIAGRPDISLSTHTILTSADAFTNDDVWKPTPTENHAHNWNLKQIDAPSAWDKSTGAGVNVGVIDSGFYNDHEDLKANISSTTVLSSDGDRTHGTHVAGTICATGNNNTGVVGVAHNCRLTLAGLDLNVDGATITRVMQAITYMGDKAPSVVNASFGFSTDFDCTTALPAGQADQYHEFMSYRRKVLPILKHYSAVLWVFSGGNDGVPAECSAFGGLGDTPDLDNVVSVAASTVGASQAHYSNYGKGITVAAPGGEMSQDREQVIDGIWSTYSGECTWANFFANLLNPCPSTYNYYAGTSMAAPHVTGTAALAFSGRTMSPAEVKSCLIAGAEAGGLKVPGQDYFIINASKTVDCSTGNLPEPPEARGLTGVKALAASNYTAYALKHDGTVWAWGLNDQGQLGDGSTNNSSIPVKAQGLSSVVSISTSGSNAYAIKADGTVWTWGDGNYDAGFGPNILIPTQVPGLSDAAAITAGDLPHVLKKDGTVWTWGSAWSGQLGNGKDRGSDTPVQATGLTGVTQVSASWGSVYALKDDGTVWAWGGPYYDFMNHGQLGLGSIATANVPMQIAGLTDVSSLDTELMSAYAVKTDGTVWSWGYNPYGQLGNGSQSNSNLPAPIPGLVGVSKVTAVGNGSVFALAENGTVKGWGSYPRYYGLLGDGTDLGSLIPIDIPALSAIEAIEHGTNNAFAVRSDGTVWAWGVNSYTDLGIGSASNALTPTQVGTLNNVVRVTVGAANSSYALTSDGTVWAWGFNNNGQLGNGTTTDSALPVAVGR